uniref:Uncharacterized protein n=1 Tax=viral metagenome TaxID=1070528 RepID=A0A6M3JTJ2_9ZZZZ
MCNHIFDYPEDKEGNLNPDGKTITGVCRYCKVKQESYGLRWMIPRHEQFLEQNPFGEMNFFDFIDKRDYVSR